jgi:signal transduction histidine kinase
MAQPGGMSEQSSKADGDLMSLESVDNQMISLMRLILALSALTIIYIDPAEPDRFVAVTYAALVIYSAYSGLLFFLSVRHRSVLPLKLVHWIDVACYLILVALSSGTNSVFFFFFFFAILIASFRWGFKSGLSVAVISTLFFAPIALATSPRGEQFELNRFLLRPIYLLVLGYMMAYWGGSEIALKRRLRLLKEVSALANPRFGVEHTLFSVMKHLREFYDADCCLLISTDPRTRKYELLRTDRSTTGTTSKVDHIPETLAQLLLALPENLAVIFKGKRRAWPLQGSDYYAFDVVEKRQDETGAAIAESLASLLESESFLSIPTSLRDQAEARLYLTSQKRCFILSDIDLLSQVFKQIEPSLDNIRLLERLASSAAEQERERLARDIHDSIIQPYVGLQYKVAAIRNKIRAQDGELANDIERLFEMTTNEIQNLRGFVGGLREKDRQSGDFVSGLRRFVKQFSQSFEIDVQVECDGILNISDRLAAEVISIVHEGLSNIRKHTSAKGGAIRLAIVHNRLIICVENEIAINGSGPGTFQPRSISERAEDLGGHARVEENRDGRTKVTVEIPL